MALGDESGPGLEPDQESQIAPEILPPGGLPAVIKIGNIKLIWDPESRCYVFPGTGRTPG